MVPDRVGILQMGADHCPEEQWQHRFVDDAEGSPDDCYDVRSLGDGGCRLLLEFQLVVHLHPKILFHQNLDQLSVFHMIP